MSAADAQTTTDSYESVPKSLKLEVSWNLEEKDSVNDTNDKASIC